jgi:SRSO17 transposase
VQRYLSKFYRAEHRTNATRIILGLVSGLERKTCEPIAIAAGLPRKALQFFVGAGKWDDEAVMAELRAHVRQELAEPDGIVIIDPSGFPKKGTESCGVARQWCGQLGNVDNRQVGVFLAYAGSLGYAPLDRRLYLPEDWAADPARRAQCHMTLALVALRFLCLERRRVGGKTPAITVSQMRQVFTRLLQDPPPSPAAIAAEVSRVPRHNEEARIYHWFAATGSFPPHRSQPVSSRTLHPP